MPLALTFTDGTLTDHDAAEAGRQITRAFLKWHGLDGNRVMTPNVTMHLHALPRGKTLSGGEAADGAWLECKTPSFAFADRAVQEGFFKEATDIIEHRADGRLTRDRIFTNVVHTVDGTWNLDGRAMTNQELGSAISRG